MPGGFAWPQNSDQVYGSQPPARVVFPVVHRGPNAGYCTGGRHGYVAASWDDAALSEAEAAAFESASSSLSHGEVGGPMATPFGYGGPSLASSFAVLANRADHADGPIAGGGLGGCVIASGPDAGEPCYANGADAVALARRIVADYAGWRLAGSDAYYAGTPALLIDAHDDAMLFDYSATNGVGVRVCPVPRNHIREQELMHASAYNCEREILFSYSAKPAGFGPGAPRTFARTGRPVYADGTVGPPCQIANDAYLSSCDDLCSG